MESRHGLRWTLLQVTLWTIFAATVVVADDVLLQACGLHPGLNYCPSSASALAAEGEQNAKLRQQAHDLQLQIVNKRLACEMASRPKQPEPPKQPAALPADRWDKRDLSLLEGCWRLGRDTKTTYSRTGTGPAEMCDVKAGRICFKADGTGQRETTTICPSTGTVHCTVAISATFGSDGSLNTTQPTVPCGPPGTFWMGPPNSLACQRQNDSLALCRDKIRFEHEFRREQ